MKVAERKIFHPLQNKRRRNVVQQKRVGEGNKMEERPNWRRYRACVGRNGDCEKERGRIACVIYVVGRRKRRERETLSGPGLQTEGLHWVSITFWFMFPLLSTQPNGRQQRHRGNIRRKRYPMRCGPPLCKLALSGWTEEGRTGTDIKISGRGWMCNAVQSREDQVDSNKHPTASRRRTAEYKVQTKSLRLKCLPFTCSREVRIN